MAESRAERMQVVLLLANRKEQEMALQLSEFTTKLQAEEEQLKQLDEYAAQYLKRYADHKNQVRAQELIAYSSFIERLGQVRKDQATRLESLYRTHAHYQKLWQEAHRKREVVEELIERLKQEQNLVIEKRLQKELDELVGQEYTRRAQAASRSS